MKKLLVLGFGIGLLATVSARAAFITDGTVFLTQGSFQSGDGGEFHAHITSGPAYLGTDFQTFCLEESEYFGYNNSYSYKVNNGAVAGGGPSGGPLVNDPNSGLTKDVISKGTAWLYSQFRAQTLPGYDFGNTAAHITDAGLLQNAFWMLENEIAWDGSNLYIQKVMAGLGLSTQAQLQADSGGAFGVVVLNMFDGFPEGGAYNNAFVVDGNTHYRNQDMLAIVPEPSSLVAGALLVLPFGTSVFRIMRRNRATGTPRV